MVTNRAAIGVRSANRKPGPVATCHALPTLLPAAAGPELGCVPTLSHLVKSHSYDSLFLFLINLHFSLYSFMQLLRLVGCSFLALLHTTQRMYGTCKIDLYLDNLISTNALFFLYILSVKNKQLIYIHRRYLFFIFAEVYLVLLG